MHESTMIQYLFLNMVHGTFGSYAVNHNKHFYKKMEIQKSTLKSIKYEIWPLKKYTE